jgi:hypothetical protein
MNMFYKSARTLAIAVLVSLFSVTACAAQSFTAQTFAKGTALGATSPDSVLFGDGSIWISYQNGADSTGLFGSSTVVRYSPSGAIQNNWSIPGNVDGLRVDPSGLIWALQNNDGNSTLTTINPVTNGRTGHTYGNTYTNVPNRGFDDVVFLKGSTFLSETNPANPTDPIVLKLTTGLSSPLQVAGIMNSQFTGTNLATGMVGTDTITDSDSLIRTPSGDLALTGEADQQIVFIHNPGQPGQSESFINLLGTDGKTITGFPDDTAYATAKSGYFILADTGANTVYKIYASGLTVGSVFVDVGAEFGSLDLSTGIVTPIWTGTSPHGVEFVPTPEPGTLSMFAFGVIGLAGMLRRKLGF